MKSSSDLLGDCGITNWVLTSLSSAAPGVLLSLGQSQANLAFCVWRLFLVEQPVQLYFTRNDKCWQCQKQESLRDIG